MHREHLKFVVVGSVDHGKSTLIGRFLYDTGSLPAAQLETIRRLCAESGQDLEFAFVLDHLEEERAKHITIDTAQTFFASKSRDYVIIDAPGHKEFLKNMITGAAQASAALLMLDVAEGLRQQTRRHAYMLSLLGIKQLIVVLNKMDKVHYDQAAFQGRSSEMKDLLARVKLDHLAIIPAAALRGENIVNRSESMPWYSGPTVIEALDLLTPTVADQSLPLRLPVQDVYEVDGQPLAVGKVASGRVGVGQQVIVSPEGRAASVTVLRKMDGPLESAGAGESVGFAVSGEGRLGRGQIICDAQDRPRLSRSITANVFWMSPKPLTVGEALTLRLGTQEIPCRAERISNRMDAGTLEMVEAAAQSLEDAAVAEVALVADGAMIQHDSFARVAEMGRLVLARGADIVAGGIVVD
jgi:sulfate adenylyltransferase large subunit